MNKRIVKDTIAMFVITLVAGLLLSFVYEITKDPIAKQTQIRKEKAYKEVLSKADYFEDIELDSSEADDLLKSKNLNATINEAAAACDKDGNVIGYVCLVTSHEGYGGDIKIAVGVSIDGTVTGISMMSLSETPGVGMKANDEDFLNQYKDKKVDNFVYTKNDVVADNEIDALSGATITTNAVTNAVNAGIAYCNSLQGGN